MMVMMVKQFPVLQKSGQKIYVDWDCLNEDWALKIHGQTLKRLAERGGLSPEEIFLNVECKKASEIKNITASLASDLVNKIRIN